MSTGLIIAIVVAVVIILALLVLLPRLSSGAKQKKAQRELESRRTAVAEQHRSEASERERSAEIAEQRARMAQQEAERERAEAGLQQERAKMHERGLADHELIDENERDRFAGVSDGVSSDHDRGADDPAARDGSRAAAGQDAAPATDYDQGRADERRLERERITDDVRESDRTSRP